MTGRQKGNNGPENGRAPVSIADSYETYTQEHVKKMVKKRSSCESESKSDNAPALFTLDPFGKLASSGAALRELRATHHADADADADGVNNRQSLRIGTWIAATSGEKKWVADEHRPALELSCSMSPAELTRNAELVLAHDDALCHNLYDMCDAKLGRLLNADHLKALAKDKALGHAAHKKLLMQQFMDDAEEEDLLTYFEKPREEGLPVTLWVAERRAGRALLEKDGMQMKEKSWLTHALVFLSSDERTILDMPANRDLPTYMSDSRDPAGCTMEDLEEAVAISDPEGFKRFRHNVVVNPLAKRVLHRHRAVASASKFPTSGGTKVSERRGKQTSEKELSSNQTESKKSKNQKNRNQKSKG
jgi:hypothetical protein